MRRPDRRTAGKFGFLDGIRELPSLPQVLVGISRVAADPKSKAADLADVILMDQAMTMKVLRIANSAQYAMCPQRVTTVSRAVILLGFESVRAMALGLGAFNLLSALQRGGRIHEDFWKNSITSAVICQDLASLVGMPVPEEAFVAGLLHDVGKLILAESNPDKAAELYGQGLEGPSLLSAEARAFGANHAEVAGELALRWELPDVLQKAVACHHRHYAAMPENRADRVAFLVGVSKSLVQVGGADSMRSRDVAAKVARLVRRPVGNVIQMLQGLPAKIEEYAGFFEIRLDDLKTYTMWVEEEQQRLHEQLDDREQARRSEERRQAELAAVREVHGFLLQGAGREAVARRVLRAARECAGSRRVAVALVESRGKELRCAWGDGDITPDFMESFAFPLDERGVLTGVVHGGQPANVFDVALPYFTRLLSQREARVFDTPAFAVLPLKHREECVGVLYVDRQEGDEAFSDEEMETLAALADLLSLAFAGSGA